MTKEKEVEYLSDRISVVQKPEKLSVIIKAYSEESKNRWLSIWLMLWTLTGVAFIVSFFVLTLSKNDKILYAVTIAFWFYFEYVILKAWRWRKYGFEQINIRDGKWLMKRDVKGRGIVYTYPTKSIRRIEIEEDRTPSWMKVFGGDYWDISGETLTMSVAGEYVRFGNQLGQKEAKRLKAILEKYIPADSEEEKAEKETAEKESKKKKKK